MSGLGALRPLLVDDSVRVLLEKEPLDRCERLLEELPCASAGGFECPLGPTPGGASFSVRLTEADGTLGNGSSAPFDALARVESARADACSPLWQVLPEVWLEFDVDSAATPTPNVFGRLSTTLGFGPSLGPALDTRLEATLAVICGFARALDLDAPAELVRRCVCELPASSRIVFVGAMVGRGGGLRLTIGRVPLIELTSFLTRVGWTERHPIPPLLGALRLARASVTHVGLHLDLERDELGPRVGLELAPAPTGWERLLSALCAERGCATRETEALLAWPKRFHAATAGGRWPADALEHNDLERVLNHLKLVHDADLAGIDDSTNAARFATGGLHVKAYLAYSYRDAFPDPSIWAAL
jgi:hypothetical protein